MIEFIIAQCLVILAGGATDTITWHVKDKVLNILTIVNNLPAASNVAMTTTLHYLSTECNTPKNTVQCKTVY